MSDNFHQDVFDNDFSYSENEENTEQKPFLQQFLFQIQRLVYKPIY